MIYNVFTSVTLTLNEESNKNHYVDNIAMNVNQKLFLCHVHIVEFNTKGHVKLTKIAREGDCTETYKYIILLNFIKLEVFLCGKPDPYLLDYIY